MLRCTGKMEKENDALKFFYHGYEDSVIAALTKLSEEEVKRLRKAWEAWS